MLAPVEAQGVSTTSVAGGQSAARGVVQKPPVPVSITSADSSGAGVRKAQPTDAQFLTVEPDGRDDISFMDRLRHAIRTVFDAVQKPDDAAAATERALAAAEEALANAAGSQDFFVQIRVVGVDVSYADSAGDDSAAYASHRRLGVEIGVARGGAVRAEDTVVTGLDGRSFGLTAEQTRTGLTSGHYRRIEIGGSEPSAAARERLEAAQAGLARVKATQDALKAYRSGDVDPLKRLLGADNSPAGGRFGAVFPGIGALAIN